MKKEKIHIEYPLNATSRNTIWSAISTPSGLENWFADNVTAKEKIFTFRWGKTEVKEAEVIAIRAFSFIRFRWADEEDDKNYFELKMNYNELIGDYVLEVTDHVEPEEKEGQQELWNSEIDTLKRACGM